MSVSQPSDPRRKIALAEMLTLVARLACLASIVTTVASFAARYFWVADLLANLRIQLVIAIICNLLLCRIARQRRLFAWTTCCLAIQVGSMAPAVWPVTQQKPSGPRTIRVMTINVLTSNTDYHRVSDQIIAADPDIVAIIELSTDLKTHLDNHTANVFRHSVGVSQDVGNFGIGLYSKSPLEQVDLFTLNERISSVEVMCMQCRVIATHPLPPLNAEQFRSRNEHLNQLAARVADAHATNPRSNLIVMGDLNVTPWSPHFDRFENQSGLHRARTGLGIAPTWYARRSFFPFGLVLDHVLIGKTMRCTRYQVGPPMGSDHRSVSTDIEIGNQ